MAESGDIVCDCGYRFSTPLAVSDGPLSCPSCGQEVSAASGRETAAPGLVLYPEDAVPEEWKAGDVYLDRYEVVEQLGQGAMGKVFKILHRGWNQYLAVKCPRRETVQEFGGALCFEHECETWIRVGLHPNTVACYYARRLGGLPRVFAEYVDGRTLHEWIQRKKLYSGSQRENLRQILLTAIQIAWGLQHAHRRGVIHQDIKPANIMMTLDGVPKVTDFGLARRSEGFESFMDASSVQVSGMTPAYCSPEQAFRDHITHRTDLWSWGLVAFEMFSLEVVWPTGTAALEALERWLTRSSRRSEPPEMPAEFAALLRHCFQANPLERPAGMAAVAADTIRIYEAIFQEAFPLSEPPAIEASGDALNNRAISLMDFGKQPRALKVWEHALREAPGHPQSAFNYGLLRWREGVYTDYDALAAIHASTESHPGEPLPMFLELRMHIERGAIGEAEECLRKLDEAAPGTPGLDSVRETIERSRPAARGIEATWDAHQGATTAMLLDPDAARLYTGGEDNRVQVWDALSGALLSTLDGHQNTITALAWSPARGQLASVAMDRRVRIWDLATGVCVHTHGVLSTRPRVLEWIAERGTLLLGDTDGALYEIDPESGPGPELLGRIPNGLRAFANAPAAGLAFAAAPGGDIHVLSLPDFTEVDCFHLHTAEVTALAVSPDGGLLASGDATGALIVSEVSGGAHVGAFHAKGETVLGCAFAGGTRHVLSITAGRMIRLWQPASSRCIWSTVLPVLPLPILATGPDGALAWLALSNNKLGRVRVSARDSFAAAPLVISKAVDTGQLIGLEREFRTGLSAAAQFYKEGRHAQAASQLHLLRARPEHSRRREILNSWTRLYSKLSRVALRSSWDGEILLGHHGPVRALTLSLQASYLVSGGNDATIRVWDLNAGKLMRQFSGHAGPVRSVVLAETQERLISSSEDGTLKVWNVRNGRCERTLQHPGGAPEAMALSPDGRILATAGWELHAWDLELGTRAGGLPGHEGGCTAVAWARSGRFLVSGGADARINFWNPDAGVLLGSRQCPHGPVTVLSIAPMEAMLVSAGGNPWDRHGKACVWNVTEGTPAQQIEAHDAPVGFAALTLDQRFVMTAAGDGVLQVHSAVTAETVRKQPLGASPSAMILANDASRMIWSDADGALRVVCFDWELAPVDPSAAQEALIRKLFSIYAMGLRPYVNHFREPASASARSGGWPLEHEVLPLLDQRALQRFNYLAGCAGLGTCTLPNLQALATQYLDSLKLEKK